ncbi:MAG: non-heme iron oxygenase ferredoxin subunit [Acidobacteria bacterium]|nr:non-heme iron oxygenase ferredoxin subunit [Acidobacteriota bacterium]
MAARPVTVSQVADIKPGELAAVDVEGTRITIANANGRFYAFDDTCTHEQCSLADGILDGTIVTCACHGAQFDVTNGTVVAPPAPTPVRTYSLHVRDGQVVIEV